MLIKILRVIIKIVKETRRRIYAPINKIITLFIFKSNGVEIPNNFKTNGIPIVNVNLHGRMKIGNNFLLNNGKFHNIIGRQQKNYFIVGKDAFLEIGNNVGISATAIICQKNITIGNNVFIGGNTVIYDTDFHSSDTYTRTQTGTDVEMAVRRPVVINNNVFIGAHSTILKGVTIGANSIIGACSVVTKDIPANEVWGGNPARFIKKIE